MPNYIPYTAKAIAARAAAGQGMITPSGYSSGYAPSILGKASRTTVPSFERGVQTKHGVHLLQYPLDVADDPTMGHHILFNISTIDKGKLMEAAGKRKDAMEQWKSRLETEIGNVWSDRYDNKATEKQLSRSSLRKQAIENLQKAKFHAPRGAANKDTTSILAQSPRAHLKTTIALYMPPTVSVQYGAEWTEKSIGMIAQIGHDAIKAFSAGLDEANAMKIVSEAGEGLKHLTLTALDTVAPGAKELQAIETGKVVTERMELMFQSIGRRNFSYEFTFIPRSELEAVIIDEIVFAFKYHMASDLVKGTGGKEYTIPDMFDIQYMYHNKQNSFLNKISTCALESMDVSYGGDKYQTYPESGKGGRRSSTGQAPGSGTPPSSTKITLGFKELELITKSKVLQGF